MTAPTQQTSMVRRSGSAGLYDVLDLILDRGLVIDVFARVSLVGIELLTVDVRIVVASVDTYLRFAEACNRLDLTASTRSETLPELVGDIVESGSKGKSKGVISGAAEALAGSLPKSRQSQRERSRERQEESE
ncbi:gas vesicle protein GvpJ [Gandjariella thermophila]|uniref:Gas vesicle protein A n=1 Tax=Gandjariella thermophila TaxID=1931992 RepID=A0A4D4JBY1_9PSEU|nr:gas vesicle protein GvpJ [Gandjariella thermophila]GDY32530.1 hypothetical protein GTS_41630 [Gandjariella thermophila]